MPVFAVVSEHEEVREHYPHHGIIQDVPGLHDDGIQHPPVPPGSSRQKCCCTRSANVDVSSGQGHGETFDKTYNYNPEEGIPDFRWFASINRESHKRKAEDISRSECEVIAFLTHNTTSQQSSCLTLSLM